jgi:hypothetical protein
VLFFVLIIPKENAGTEAGGYGVERNLATDLSKLFPYPVLIDAGTSNQNFW